MTFALGLLAGIQPHDNQGEAMSTTSKPTAVKAPELPTRDEILARLMEGLRDNTGPLPTSPELVVAASAEAAVIKEVATQTLTVLGVVLDEYAAALEEHWSALPEDDQPRWSIRSWFTEALDEVIEATR